jgi:hypothetical protein
MALIEHLRPKPPKLYSTKQTPRGSVVVLGDCIVSEYEMPTAIAQQQADWLNHRKSACPVTSL